MRGTILYGPHDIRFEERPAPTISHFKTRRPYLIPSDADRHPIASGNPPSVRLAVWWHGAVHGMDVGRLRAPVHGQRKRGRGCWL